MDEKYTSNENNINNGSESSDSLYSYSYRDKEQSKTTHEGDYYEKQNQEEVSGDQSLEQAADSSNGEEVKAEEQTPQPDMSYKTEYFEQTQQGGVPGSLHLMENSSLIQRKRIGIK